MIAVPQGSDRSGNADRPVELGVEKAVYGGVPTSVVHLSDRRGVFRPHAVGPGSRPDRACTHRITRICEGQAASVLADPADPGRRPLAERGRHRGPRRARAPVERGAARLTSWRVVRRYRGSPTAGRRSPKRSPARSGSAEEAQLELFQADHGSEDGP